MLCLDGPEGQLQVGSLPWAPRTMSRACEDGCPSADGPTGHPPRCRQGQKLQSGGLSRGAGSPGEAGRRGLTALSQERAAQAAGGDGLGNRGAVGTGVAGGAGGLWLDARFSGVDLTFGIRSH